VTAAIGTTAFLLLSPDVFSPGLAGSELMLVFGAGVLTAAVLSLAGGLAGPRWPAHIAVPAGVPEYALPAAGYTYRLWGQPRPDGRIVIVLTDPDLPRGAALPLCETAASDGFPCYLVEWGREGVPRYPDALAAVPMCISACGGEEARAYVVGSGAAADLALRSAADDERVEGVLAVSPALTPSNIATGLALLASMNVVDAWRWQHSWDRRSFVKALRAKEALARLGAKAHVLEGPDDGLFRLPPSAATEFGKGVQWCSCPGLSHYPLTQERAVTCLQSVLTGSMEGDLAQPG